MGRTAKQQDSIREQSITTIFRLTRPTVGYVSEPKGYLGYAEEARLPVGTLVRVAIIADDDQDRVCFTTCDPDVDAQISAWGWMSDLRFHSVTNRLEGELAASDSGDEYDHKGHARADSYLR